MTGEFSNEFPPIKSVEKNDMNEDKMFKKLKRKKEDRKAEEQKRRKTNLEFFNTFKLYNSEVGQSTESKEVEDEMDQGTVSTESKDDEIDRETLGMESKEDEIDQETVQQIHNEIDQGIQKVQEIQELEQGTQKVQKVQEIEELEQESYNNTPSPQDIKIIKSSIRKQLLHNHNIIHQSQFNEIFKIMESAIDQNQGNSTLVVGPKSSGKTTIINEALNKLNDLYPDQFLTIRLNSYVHNDDVTAIRSIAAQLDDFFQSRNIEINVEFRRLSATFKNILDILDNGSIKISIFFIIDNLESFTHGNKQTLLYNLLELSQTSSTPILVIGTSTKFTTRELLEKRVRSRFSQRLIILNKISKLDDFISHCVGNLRLSEADQAKLTDSKLGKAWDQQFDQLLAVPNSNFKHIIVSNFNSVRNIKRFNNCMMLPISKLTPSKPFIDDTLVGVYNSNQITNPVQAILTTLSNLELLTVIAAARVIEKSNLMSVNFNLVYQEYVTMLKQFNLNKSIIKSSSILNHSILPNLKINIKIWDMRIIKNCWMSLYKLGLLIDYVPNTVERGVSIANSNKYFVLEDIKMLQIDISLKELTLFLKDSSLRPLTKL